MRENSDILKRPCRTIVKELPVLSILTFLSAFLVASSMALSTIPAPSSYRDLTLATEAYIKYKSISDSFQLQDAKYDRS